MKAQTLRSNVIQSNWDHLWDYLERLIKSLFEPSRRLVLDTIPRPKEENNFSSKQKSTVNMHPNHQVDRTLASKQNLRSAYFLGTKQATLYAQDLYDSIHSIFKNTSVKVTIILFVSEGKEQVARYFLDDQENCPPSTRYLEKINLNIKEVEHNPQTQNMYFAQAIDHINKGDFDKLQELEGEVELKTYVDERRDPELRNSGSETDQFIERESRLLPFLHGRQLACFQPAFINHQRKLGAAIFYTYPISDKQAARKAIGKYGKRVRKYAQQSLANFTPQRINK